MHRNTLFVALLTISSFVWTGCDQGADYPTTLRVTPQHHGRSIPGCTIMIKYGTKDMPDAFDDSAKCVMKGDVPVATFTNLRPGSYYVYGRGFDNSIGEAVAGGISVSLFMGADYLLKLPVTEGD